MNLSRKTATTLGGIFFAVLLIAALAPKATRGVAAALVQITNTDASPVPVEDHARQAVILFAGANNSFLGVPFTNANGTPFTMPAGKRLVIEQISGRLDLPVGASPYVASLIGSLGADFYEGSLTTPTETSAGSGEITSVYIFSQSVRFYSDTSPSLFLAVSGPSGGNVALNAIGYLVDCTGACPAQQ